MRDDTAHFCSNCGKRIPDTDLNSIMFCSDCSHKGRANLKPSNLLFLIGIIVILLGAVTVGVMSQTKSETALPSGETFHVQS